MRVSEVNIFGDGGEGIHPSLYIAVFDNDEEVGVVVKHDSVRFNILGTGFRSFFKQTVLCHFNLKDHTSVYDFLFNAI